MRVLLYNDLDTRAIPGFAKLRATLEADNFVSADVRKVGDNLFRARLNRSDRLLFSLYRHSGETCCLILEYIRNHAYDRSRFLAAGVRIDEDRIPAVESPEADPAADAGLPQPETRALQSAGQDSLFR